VNKTSIKVIKRKDAEAKASAKIQNAREPKQTATPDEEKIKRRSHREIVGTVSNWISERRENNRNEKDAANSEIFGDGFLLKEI
jgi:hypothetical protein